MILKKTKNSSPGSSSSSGPQDYPCPPCHTGMFYLISLNLLFSLIFHQIDPFDKRLRFSE